MEQYLLQYHLEDIEFILQSYKVDDSFNILLDLSLLNETNINLYKKLSENYYKEANKWRQAIIQVQRGILINSKEEEETAIKNNVDIKPFNHPNVNHDFKINPDKNLFKLVSFRATIVKKYQPKQRIVTKKFMCMGCRKIVIVEADKLLGYGFYGGHCTDIVTVKDEKDEPKTSVCNASILPCKFTEKKYIKTRNTQRYEVSVERLDFLKSYGEKTYSIDVEGDLINSYEVGEMVDVIGIVKTRGSRNRSKIRRFSIFAVNLEKKQEKEFTKNIDSNIQHRLLSAWLHDINNNQSELISRNEIVAHAFPRHFGSASIKLSILLTICSGVGLTKKKEDKREVLHLMLCGTENAGKRALLKKAAELCYKSNEVSCFSLSVASLTAKTFKLKKQGTSNIEAGVLLRANEGISCFYDFEMLKKKHRQILHEIMETQKLKLTTAKLKTHIKLSNSIIAAHRIKKIGTKRKAQRDEMFTTKMLRLEESLLSRFDLIFLMKEPQINDTSIRDKSFIYDNYKLPMLNLIVDEVTEDFCEENFESDVWPFDRLTAHIALAKTYKSVKITKEVEQILLKYYLFCSSHRNIPKWRSSYRLCDSIKRVAVAHARLMLRTETKILDAVTSIFLFEKSYLLGHLMDSSLELYNNFIGPDDEYVAEVLQNLNMPMEEYLQKYHEEQRDTSNIEQQIVEMRSQFDKKNIDEKKKFEEKKNLSKELPASKVVVTKKKERAKKVPLKSTKNQKSIDNFLHKTDVSKRKYDNHPENDTVKKAKVEDEPIFSIAIRENLLALTKVFNNTNEEEKLEKSSGENEQKLSK